MVKEWWCTADAMQIGWGPIVCARAQVKVFRPATGAALGARLFGVATTAEMKETGMEREKGRAVFPPWDSTHAIEYLETGEPLISIAIMSG